MAAQTRTFHIDGEDYAFNFTFFIKTFNADKTQKKVTMSQAEEALSTYLNLSTQAIHGWRFQLNGPSSIDIIQNMAKYYSIKDYTLFLNRKVDENKMTNTDRIMDSLKRIYDAAIIYLDDFETSDGFNNYWFIKQDEGCPEKAIENALYDLVSDKLHKVEIVLQQEYIVLHKLDLYSKLENYIYNDLCSLYDGKLSYAYRFECVVEDVNGNRELSAHEEYEIALNKLNEIMSEYF